MWDLLAAFVLFHGGAVYSWVLCPTLNTEYQTSPHFTELDLLQGTRGPWAIIGLPLQKYWFWTTSEKSPGFWKAILTPTVSFFRKWFSQTGCWWIKSTEPARLALSICGKLITTVLHAQPHSKSLFRRADEALRTAHYSFAAVGGLWHGHCPFHLKVPWMFLGDGEVYIFVQSLLVLFLF